MKQKFIIAGVLLVFILASGIYYALTNSITSDELTHITAGYINIRLNDYRFNIEHPPLVKQLATLPLLFLKLNFPFSIYKASVRPDDIVDIQDLFLFKMGNNLDFMLLLSRLPNILISVLLGIFIYLYSRRLNGPWAGIISLILFTFSPSFLGHSPLVTMDTTVSCFYFATIYFLMMFFETRRNLYLSLTGIFMGLALVSKFSALTLIPVIYILILLCVFQGKDLYNFKNYILLLPLVPFVCSYKSSFKFVAPVLFAFIFCAIFSKKSAYLKKAAYACAILLIILTIAFIFIILDYTDFKWFPFHSATKAYFKGFSTFEGHARGGQGNSYLLGMHSARGWWYYFPMAILFKEPFAFLMIFLLGLGSFFLKKENIMSKLLLLIPALAYLFVSMFMNKVNIGIRHILPVYPFLFVIAGYSVIAARSFKYMRYVLCLLLIVLAIDVLAAYPVHLSYFNRLIGGTSNGYKYLNDSNLGWGQDWKRVGEYLRKNNIDDVAVKAEFSAYKNCDYYKIPYRSLAQEEFVTPKKGYYIVETNELAAGDIKWLKRIRSINRIGGSLLLYNITDKGIDKLRAD